MELKPSILSRTPLQMTSLDIRTIYSFCMTVLCHLLTLQTLTLEKPLILKFLRQLDNLLQTFKQKFKGFKHSYLTGPYKTYFSGFITLDGTKSLGLSENRPNWSFSDRGKRVRKHIEFAIKFA